MPGSTDLLCWDCHTVCVEITRFFFWGGGTLLSSRHCSLCVCVCVCDNKFLLHLWSQKYKFHVLAKCTGTKFLNKKYKYYPLHLHSVLNTFTVWFVASCKKLPRMAYFLRTLHCALNVPLDSLWKAFSMKPNDTLLTCLPVPSSVLLVAHFPFLNKFQVYFVTSFADW